MPDPAYTSYINKITLPTGGVYWLRDEQARELIQSLTGGAMTFEGVSNDYHDLYDYSHQATISMSSGNTFTATRPGQVVIRDDGKEFIWATIGTDSMWQEFGDMSALKSFAYANTGTGTYTPTGTVSQPTATFSGTQATIKATGTPSGTVSKPTFSGTQATIKTSGTPGGTVSKPTFSGTPATISVKGTPTGKVPYTPAGSISLSQQASLSLTQDTVNEISNLGALPTTASQTVVTGVTGGAAATTKGQTVVTGVTGGAAATTKSQTVVTSADISSTFSPSTVNLTVFDSIGTNVSSAGTTINKVTARGSLPSTTNQTVATASSKADFLNNATVNVTGTDHILVLSTAQAVNNVTTAQVPRISGVGSLMTTASQTVTTAVSGGVAATTKTVNVLKDKGNTGITFTASTANIPIFNAVGSNVSASTASISIFKSVGSNVSASTASIAKITAPGSLPSTISKGIVTGASLSQAEYSFTGTPATATLTGNELTSTGAYTPAGTVSQPTFSGTPATYSGTYTPAGTVSQPTFTGAAATYSATYTPQGTVTVSQPTFTGANATITVRPS